MLPIKMVAMKSEFNERVYHGKIWIQTNVALEFTFEIC